MEKFAHIFQLLPSAKHYTTPALSSALWHPQHLPRNIQTHLQPGSAYLVCIRKHPSVGASFSKVENRIDYL